MIEKRDMAFAPAGEGKTRRLHIYLPDGYAYDGERYPVMYFFDGHNLFFDGDATYGKSWGMKQFLDSWGKRLIVVGVECSHEGAARLTEYCPYHFTQGFLGEINGTGDATICWMIDTLKPMIDREYRTIPFRECTAIGGSSMGGMMSLYAVVRYNRWFSKAACLSSTIGPCMEDFRVDITRCDVSPDTRVYLSWGEWEGGGSKMYPRSDTDRIMAARNGELAALLDGRGAVTQLYDQPCGRHCEADWEKQVPRFMNFLWMSP